MKLEVEIMGTYKRHIEVELQDENIAYQNIDDKINEGEIELPCNGEDDMCN